MAGTDSRLPRHTYTTRPITYSTAGSTYEQGSSSNNELRHEFRPADIAFPMVDMSQPDAFPSTSASGFSDVEIHHMDDEATIPSSQYSDSLGSPIPLPPPWGPWPVDYPAPQDGHVPLPAAPQEDHVRWRVRRRRLLTIVAFFLLLIISIVVSLVLTLIPKRGGTYDDCIVKLSVSKNKRSDFRTISEAVEASPSYSEFRVCIFIRKGIYREIIKINEEIMNISFIGEGVNKTIIYSDDSLHRGGNTWQVATLWVSGKEFQGRELTIRNTAEGGVAVENWAEQSIFYDCRFEGSNETLHAMRRAQLYLSCQFYGRTYLVSGDGATYFQKCSFHGEKLYPQQEVVFIGQNHHLRDLKPGFIFEHCTFHENDRSKSSLRTTFIGSSMGDYAVIVVIQSYLDVSLAGYLNGNSSPKSTYLAIFGNTGPGTNMEHIPGSVHELGVKEASSKYSLRAFLSGVDWSPPKLDYELDLL